MNSIHIYCKKCLETSESKGRIVEYTTENGQIFDRIEFRCSCCDNIAMIYVPPRLEARFSHRYRILDAA